MDVAAYQQPSSPDSRCRKDMGQWSLFFSPHAIGPQGMKPVCPGRRVQKEEKEKVTGPLRIHKSLELRDHAWGSWRCHYLASVLVVSLEVINHRALATTASPPGPVQRWWWFCWLWGRCLPADGMQPLGVMGERAEWLAVPGNLA